MGTQGQTHTASFCSCLLVHINSHSSRALTCLKLHLRIIEHLLQERPQCGIMRIKTRAEKAEWEKRKRVEQRRTADTGLIPTPGQKPIKTPVLSRNEVIMWNDYSRYCRGACLCVCVFKREMPERFSSLKRLFYSRLGLSSYWNFHMQ